MGPRRAAVLIGVHLLIAAHIIHWLIAGRTLSPVEPSESMYTIERGQLNAGFIFFALAIISTFIFGRFFCGWGCHLVALQDLCGWMMKKIGVRPKPFRSRLLVWVPLSLALYMFVWPTFKRDVLAPQLQQYWPEGLTYIGASPPFPGFTNELMTTGFWDTFAGPLLAIPFLLICGFATVYFLGAKGFCTYACPYGGFFAPAQQIAPGRIMVDPDKCEGCGHCTAVCTSNVRVHEEIKAYGGVVDPGCMRCMDCISVCPNDALSFKFARPAVFRKRAKAATPKPNPDLSWSEEFALAIVFLVTFTAMRGIYGLVPMLFAGGIAICVTFLSWKLWRLPHDANVRIIGAQLKRAGKVRPSGWIFSVASVLVLALVAHSAFIKAHLIQARSADSKIHVNLASVMAGRADLVPQESRAYARKALVHYHAASSIQSGGFGLGETIEIPMRSAWLHLVLGEPEKAKFNLQSVIEREGPSDGVYSDLVHVMRLLGQHDEAIALMRNTLADNVDFTELRNVAAQMLLARGDQSAALALFDDAVKVLPYDAALRAQYASYLMNAGQLPAALEQLGIAIELDPNNGRLRHDLAIALFANGRIAEAQNEIDRAARLDPINAAAYFTSAAEILVQLGRQQDAAEWVRRARAAQDAAKSRES